MCVGVPCPMIIECHLWLQKEIPTFWILLKARLGFDLGLRLVNLEEVPKKIIFDSEILLYSVKECRQFFFNNCEHTFSNFRLFNLTFRSKRESAPDPPSSAGALHTRQFAHVKMHSWPDIQYIWGNGARCEDRSCYTHPIHKETL